MRNCVNAGTPLTHAAFTHFSQGEQLFSWVVLGPVTSALPNVPLRGHGSRVSKN